LRLFDVQELPTHGGSLRIFACHADDAGRASQDAVAALRQAWSALPPDDWPQPVPALVITGDVSPERLQLLRDSGLPWLPKPVMPMRLRSWLQGQGHAPGPRNEAR
jgi:hypothetical protein